MIPQELRERRQWVVWKAIDRDGQPTKVPFQPNGQPAKSNDSTTWATFDEAVAATGYDGIGFVFSGDDPYCGIDLDGCRRSESGEVMQWARDIILEFGSYAEVSPSNTGVKIWVRGSWGRTGSKQAVPEEKVSGKEPAVEVYDKGRYFAMTGRCLKGHSEIRGCQSQLDELRKKYWSDPAAPVADFRSESAVFERARNYISRIPGAVSGQNGHGTTFRVACVLVLGFGLSSEESFSAICEWNGTCSPPWSERELRHKIGDAQKQPGERGFLRHVSPKNFDKVSVPDWTKTPAAKPRETTLKDAAKKYVTAIKDGTSSLIGLGLPELDSAIGGGVEPGELILIAARPSHGKSMVALQIVHHWTGAGLPSLFISEEMSAIAIGKRAVQFVSDIPEEHWLIRMETVESQIDTHFSDRAQCLVIEQCRTSEAAAEAIRRAKEDHGVKCVVVDYAQLLGSPGKSRYEQITNTSVCLRQVASETGVVLVALCQLNREMEKRERFEPKLSDLRDTGQLEQDADLVIFTVWPFRLDSDKDPNEYVFYIGKNRNRATNPNVVRCRFESARQRVYGASEDAAAGRTQHANADDF